MDFINETQLKKRGWSTSAIKTLLPLPAKQKTNHIKGGAPIKLYDLSIVEYQENTEEFKKFNLQLNKRKKNAGKGRIQKLNNNQAFLNELFGDIQIESVNMKYLEIEALDPANTYEGEDYYNMELVNIRVQHFTEFQIKWRMINVLRFKHSNYEFLKSRLKGLVGAEKLRKELLREFLVRIKSAYPELSETVDIQLRWHCSDLKKQNGGDHHE